MSTRHGNVHFGIALATFEKSLPAVIASVRESAPKLVVRMTGLEARYAKDLAKFKHRQGTREMHRNQWAVLVETTDPNLAAKSLLTATGHFGDI